MVFYQTSLGLPFFIPFKTQTRGLVLSLQTPPLGFVNDYTFPPFLCTLSIILFIVDLIWFALKKTFHKAMMDETVFSQDASRCDITLFKNAIKTQSRCVHLYTLTIMAYLVLDDHYCNCPRYSNWELFFSNSRRYSIQLLLLHGQHWRVIRTFMFSRLIDEHSSFAATHVERFDWFQMSAFLRLSQKT